MKYVGYYNGEIGPLEEMKIPMLDRAVYFGDGCYDATTFANNNIFAADDHLDRFYNSCKLLEIPFEMSREELRAELQKCIDANEIDHGMLYWQCSRGTTYRGHQFPPATVKPNLMIFTVPCDLIPFDKTFRLISMEDTRFLHCNIKTLNLLPNVMAAQHAKEAGCAEAVFVRDGFVTECAHSNVHILKDGALVTHPADNLILPGIARKHIIAACKKLGIPVEERPFTKQELMDADEVVVSASSEPGGVLAAAVDGIAVGGKAPELYSRILNEAVAEFESYVAARRA